MQKIISGAHIPTPNYGSLEDAPVLAYIVNIGMLGEGIVKGVWLSLPSTPEAVKAALCEIGIDGRRYKKWFVAEYVTDIGGLGDCLPAYPDLNELNLLAHIILEMDCEDMDIFEAALEYGSFDDLFSVINLSLSLGEYEFIPDVEGDEELGRYCVESFDFCDVPGIAEFLEHIDYESYGRHKRENEPGDFVDGGYIALVEFADLPYIGPGDIPLQYRIV